MTTLLNSFEGGASGTTISAGNSGGASGNAFDFVTAGSGGTCAYSNAHAAHGGLSASLATTTANSTALGWTTSIGTPTQFWFRCYMYFASLPAGITRFFTAANSGSTGLARFSVNTSGKILVQNATGATITTSTMTIPTASWFRIEGMVILSATVGQTIVKFFTPLDDPTPAETDASAATQDTLTGTQQFYTFGPNSGVANQGPFFMDDIGLSTTGYLGPSGTAGRRGSSIVPSLIAAGAI